MRTSKKMGIDREAVKEACRLSGMTHSEISIKMGNCDDFLRKMIRDGKATLPSIKSFCFVTGANENEIIAKEPKPIQSEPEQQEESHQFSVFEPGELTDEQIERIADKVAAVLAARLMVPRNTETQED